MKRPLPILPIVPVLLLLVVVCSGAALAQPAEIRITSDIAEGSLRLVLHHSKKLVYAVRAAHGRLDVIYTEPVVADPLEERFDDPILSRYEMQGDNTITFYTGPGYRTYESFELRNPFRLVIDLQGARPADPRVGKKRKNRGRPQTVIVIDPGHGGIESGAIGPTGLREKDVTLDLARRLRQSLQRNRAISVVLTRDDDRLVGLDERTAIANHNRADLFISIHLNASPRTKARGAETYFLSADATDGEARTLAALENRAFGVDERMLETPDGESRDLQLVLWDLAQNQFLAESSALAERVQRHFNELTGTRNRGVRQAPFRVLMGATMPAILVELGFISNPEEEGKFKDLAYRNQAVSAMTAAVHEFLGDLKRLSGRE